MPYNVVRKLNLGALREPGVSADEPFVIEESTTYLVNLAARLFGHALHARISPQGVAVGQWPFLMFLWEEDGLTQRELSRRISIEEPTTARTLDRMERDGLISRERNARDRRQVNVFLTERGRELRDELVPYALEVNALATHGLSEQDKAKINSLLSYMISRLV